MNLKLYRAQSEGRGANLDGIDYPLNFDKSMRFTYAVGNKAMNPIPTESFS